MTIHASTETLNFHPLPFSTRPYGLTPADIPDGTTLDGWSPRALLNIDPPPPPGWYSIPHWTGLTEPSLFIYSGNYITLKEWLSEWTEQADKMTIRAAKEGFQPVEWPAPPLLAEAGCPTVLLFPDPILREFWTNEG